MILPSECLDPVRVAEFVGVRSAGLELSCENGGKLGGLRAVETVAGVVVPEGSFALDPGGHLKHIFPERMPPRDAVAEVATRGSCRVFAVDVEAHGGSSVSGGL